MMTDQPARITPGEIAALLDQASGLAPDAPLADRITFGERKAYLLSHLAAVLGTAEAHQAASDAWSQVCPLLAQRSRTEVAT
jgi:hypothetical protein